MDPLAFLTSRGKRPQILGAIFVPKACEDIVGLLDQSMGVIRREIPIARKATSSQDELSYRRCLVRMKLLQPNTTSDGVPERHAGVRTQKPTIHHVYHPPTILLLSNNYYPVLANMPAAPSASKIFEGLTFAYDLKPERGRERSKTWFPLSLVSAGAVISYSVTRKVEFGAPLWRNIFDQ